MSDRPKYGYLRHRLLTDTKLLHWLATDPREVNNLSGAPNRGNRILDLLMGSLPEPRPLIAFSSNKQTT